LLAFVDRYNRTARPFNWKFTASDLHDLLRRISEHEQPVQSQAALALARADVCAEAIRLGRLLAGLMPDEAEVAGLLALMLLTESRREARTGPDGALVLLADQDRARWDRPLIAEGQAIVRRGLRRNQPGPYQIQTAINAVHADAASAADTDWSQILALYDQLVVFSPTPVVALNPAVAVAEVDGPAAALAVVDDLELDSYYLYHAIRADLLRRLGRRAEAAAEYQAAIDRTRNEAERGFLTRAHARLQPPVAQPDAAQPRDVCDRQGSRHDGAADQGARSAAGRGSLRGPDGKAHGPAAETAHRDRREEAAGQHIQRRVATEVLNVAHEKVARHQKEPQYDGRRQETGVVAVLVLGPGLGTAVGAGELRQQPPALGRG